MISVLFFTITICKMNMRIASTGIIVIATTVIATMGKAEVAKLDKLLKGGGRKQKADYKRKITRTFNESDQGPQAIRLRDELRAKFDGRTTVWGGLPLCDGLSGGLNRRTRPHTRSACM
eukprot:COSAG01_NODE_1451_length_10269_cov_16.336578_7_plen_119_part_00